MRARAWIWIAAITILIALGLMLLRPSRGSKAESRESSTKKPAQVARIDAASVPAPTPEVTAVSEREPLIRWSKVPAHIAMRALPLGRFRADPRLFTALDWNDILSRQSTDERMGIPKEAADLRRRGIGLVIALDGVLLGELPVDLDQGMYSYPDEYFPRPTVIPKGVLDPAKLEEKLVSMLSGGMDHLLEKLPAQFRHPESLVGLKNRAVLLLGSVAKDPQSLAYLRNLYSEGGPDLSAAAASALTYAGQDYAAQEIVSGTGAPEAKVRVLAGLSNDFGKFWYKVEGGLVFQSWSSTSDIARSLDASILELDHRSAGQDVRRASAMALVPRQDNPSVRAAIWNRLNSTDDPLLNYDVMASGVLIDGSPEVKAILVRNLDSPVSYLRMQALFKCAMIQDPGIIDRIIPHLTSEDGTARNFALAALAHAGRMNPSKAETAMRDAARRRPGDRNFANDVQVRIQELRNPPQPATILNWLEQHPEHRLP